MRDIDGVMYNTFDEAREAMVESYEETAKKGCLDCEMSMWWAYVDDGPNHDNYDWKIIEC